MPRVTRGWSFIVVAVGLESRMGRYVCTCRRNECKETCSVPTEIMHREYDRSRALAAPYSKAINAQRDVTKHSLGISTDSITQTQTTLRGDREKDREHIVAKFD